MNKATKLTALSLTIAASAFLVACGGVPSSDVATVADDGIPVSTFNKWMGIASKSQAQGGTKAAPVAINPPEFQSCVSELLSEVPAKAKKTVSPAQAKSQCQSMFDSSKGQVMQLLITSAWIEGQAKAMGIDVSEKDVKKQFEQTKKQAFNGNDAAYRKFLKQSGETEDDILFRIRVDALSTKIRDAALKGSDTVSSQEAADYYASHKQQFGQPEKRDILIIRTKTQAQAKAAKAALASGQSWAAVAKQYSQDTATKNSGGEIKGAVKGQNDPAVDKAVFVAKKGVTVGPIQGALGWYVAQVKSIQAGTTQPYSQVAAQIKQTVKGAKQQKALTSFVKEFQSKWKARTECGKYYVMELCSNAPKQAAGATSSNGGATVQQAPQQAPAGG